ncbi:hypothetical protein B7494_g4190 [Chlorociboria aeruginascens]|nr:hypothetical protein B7494_g4190 [Chlorociboria aeruginascens]
MSQTVDPEAYYGYLFDKDKKPTRVLDALLRGIAAYIVEEIGNKEDKCLTPAKLAEFYKAVGGNYDSLFVDVPHASLSTIYASTGCQHTLQPTSNNFAPPSIPALTTRGFVHWQSIEILLGPEEQVPFIQTAVLRFPLKHPDTNESFPRPLPKKAFPLTPDKQTENWHNACAEKLRRQASPLPSPSDNPSIRPHLPPRPNVQAGYTHVRPSRTRAATGEYFERPRVVPTAPSARNIAYSHVRASRPILSHSPSRRARQFPAPEEPRLGRRRGSVPENMNSPIASPIGEESGMPGAYSPTAEREKEHVRRHSHPRHATRGIFEEEEEEDNERSGSTTPSPTSGKRRVRNARGTYTTSPADIPSSSGTPSPDPRRQRDRDDDPNRRIPIDLTGKLSAPFLLGKRTVPRSSSKGNNVRWQDLSEVTDLWRRGSSGEREGEGEKGKAEDRDQERPIGRRVDGIQMRVLRGGKENMIGSGKMKERELLSKGEGLEGKGDTLVEKVDREMLVRRGVRMAGGTRQLTHGVDRIQFNLSLNASGIVISYSHTTIRNAASLSSTPKSIPILISSNFEFFTAEQSTIELCVPPTATGLGLGQEYESIRWTWGPLSENDEAPAKDGSAGDVKVFHFGQGGEIDGKEEELKAEIVVKNKEVWTRLCANLDLGFSESYMLGDVECDNIVNLIRIYIKNRSALGTGSGALRLLLFTRLQRLIFPRSNTRSNSLQNVQTHYDTSNFLFSSFLSPDLSYSCPHWSPASSSPNETLEEAQYQKIHNILSLAQIKPEHHILDIGGGWCTLAIEAVRLYGCRVTVATLSIEQKKLGELRIKERGYEGKIIVILCDYRDIPKVEGGYDRIVTVGMVEHVGREFLNGFFTCIDELLNPKDGIMVLQGITIANFFHDNRPTIDTFIDIYIFPGGYLPSVPVLLDAIHTGSRAKLEVSTMKSIGLHYVKALRLWRENFERNWVAIREDFVKGKGGEGKVDAKTTEAWRRRWLYYFSSCEAAFRVGMLGDHVVVATRRPRVDEQLDVPL